MYKRVHCVNCGRKFSGVYERRRHERLVKCEKKEVYNDIEILVRLEKLEVELNESKVRMGKLEKELELLSVKRRKRKKNIKKENNIKQKKILEYGF